MGTVRVGLAASDPDGCLAMPVDTLDRAQAPAHIATYAREHGAERIYVGLPRHLSGAEGASAQMARDFATELAELLTDDSHRCTVLLIDERLSTVSAETTLRVAGRKGRRRRAVVDQVAAVNILQSALDMEKLRGTQVGERISR